MSYWAEYETKSVASRLKEVILPLCLALQRLPVEYCTQLWAPQYQRGIDIGMSPAESQHEAYRAV